MLSKRALMYLEPLKYDPDADRLSCVIPMGGIYWADEIPDFHELMELPEQDRMLIYRLFSVRFKLWNGNELDQEDALFWEAARSQVPDYPVFHRLHLSDSDRLAQTAVEEETLEAFDAMFARAEDVTFKDDGSFSATYKLTDATASDETSFPSVARVFTATVIAAFSTVLLSVALLLVPPGLALIVGLSGLLLFYLGKSTERPMMLGFGGVVMFAGVLAWAMRQ